MGILSLIATFLGIIPGLSGVAAQITGYVFDAKVKMAQARIGGDRDVAVEIVKKAAIDSHETTERLKVISGSWVLLGLTVAFAFPLIAFEWTVILHDKLGWFCAAGPGGCSTDPLAGQVGDWATTIIASLFGSTSAVALGSMWFNRKGS